MNKHRFLKVISICIVLVIICFVSCFLVCTIKYSTKEMTVYLKDGNSFASNWVYKMSVEDVLEECDHQVLYAFGGDYQYWEFEAVGEGEVTIYYEAKYELDVIEEKCFSVTYYASEDGTITELISQNKPAEYDNIPDNPFKVFAIRVGNIMFIVVMSIIFFFFELFGL